MIIAGERSERDTGLGWDCAVSQTATASNPLIAHTEALQDLTDLFSVRLKCNRRLHERYSGLATFTRAVFRFGSAFCIIDPMG
jgi:hypothetical protein